MTSPVTRYRNSPRFTALLICAGLNINKRVILNDDEFTTMELLVEHLTYTMKGFKSHLFQVDKHFCASTDPGINTYYTPVVISRFLDAMNMITQLMKTYHTIPDTKMIFSR